MELFFNSDYFKKANEYWMPCGLSVYENIKQLVPNHVLILSEKRQERYWPNKKIINKNAEEAIDNICDSLTSGIEWGKNHFKLALPITAGFDSRILLAASKKIVNDLYIFTLSHKQALNHRHPDISIPRRLLKKIGLKHYIINDEAIISHYEKENYILSNSTSRFSELKYIFSLNEEIFSDRVWMSGNASEIGKLHKTKLGTDSIMDDIFNLTLIPEEWRDISFIRQELDVWFKRALRLEVNYGVDVRNLFYWEHRMGNWCARAYNESDFRFEIFTPFNSREVLENLISVDSSIRTGPDYKFYSELSNKMWPEVMILPCNPETKYMFINRLMKAVFRHFGFQKILKVFSKYLDV